MLGTSRGPWPFRGAIKKTPWHESDIRGALLRPSCRMTDALIGKPASVADLDDAAGPSAC
jgi:hypothetical protein